MYNLYNYLKECIICTGKELLPEFVNSTIQKGLQDPRIGMIVGGTVLSFTGISLLAKSSLPSFLKNKLWKSEKRPQTIRRLSLAAMGFSSLVLGIAGITSATLKLMTNSEIQNICEVQPPLCKNNLGIERKNMPQLEGKTKKNFISLYSKNSTFIDSTKLTPIQNQGNYQKIQSMIKDTLSGSWDACTQKPILISKDYYIIDGHHRAWTCQILKRDIRAVIIHLPRNKALQTANRFPGVKHQSYKDKQF